MARTRMMGGLRCSSKSKNARAKGQWSRNGIFRHYLCKPIRRVKDGVLSVTMDAIHGLGGTSGM